MNMAPDPESCFEKAIDAFKTKSGLSTRQLMDMEMTSLFGLKRTLAIMQSKQEASKTMKHLRRLQLFLDTMEYHSSAVSVFTNASDIVAFFWICCGRTPLKFYLHLKHLGSHEIYP